MALKHGERFLVVMNVARLKRPLTCPTMSEFKLALDPINEIARVTPGFIWMYDGETNCVKEIQEDPLLMPQMSMWKDLASLRHFVFKSGHGMYFRRRREWFEQPKVSNDKYASDNVLWWHESYTIKPRNTCTNDKKLLYSDPPTLQHAFYRLDSLRKKGPSEFAFDLANSTLYCEAYPENSMK